MVDLYSWKYRIMKLFIKNKTVSYLIIMVMLAVFITGCEGKMYLTTGLNADQLLKVSGKEVPMSIAKLVLATEMKGYAGELGDEVWKLKYDGKNLSENLKDTVKYQLAELLTISMLAEEKNISLTKGEKEKINAAAKEFFGLLSDEDKKKFGVKEEQIRNLYSQFVLSEKFYNMITERAYIEISDEEARVIRVQYCFVRTTMVNDKGERVPLNADGMEAAYSRAAEALEAIKTGTDFTVIAKEFSDDSIYEYEFGRNTMDQAFEEVAFSLNDGEISNIIEGTNGYYIIKCVSSYDSVKTEDNKKKLLLQYKNEEFRKVYEPYMKNQTFEYNDDAYNDIDINEIVADNNSLYEIFEKYFAD